MELSKNLLKTLRFSKFNKYWHYKNTDSIIKFQFTDNAKLKVFLHNKETNKLNKIGVFSSVGELLEFMAKKLS